MDDLNLEINGFSVINEAKINLNKINVVCGVNSSGKSTVSRFLYCFLKANVLNTDEYIKIRIFQQIAVLYSHMRRTLPEDDDFSVLLKDYEKFKQEIKDNSEIEFIDYLIGLLDLDKSFLASLIIKDLVYKENVSYFEKGFAKLYNSSFETLVANQCVSDAKFDNEGLVESCSDEYDTYSDLYVIKTKGHLDFDDVLYIDSISILDLLYFEDNNPLIGGEPTSNYFIRERHHTNYIIKCISGFMGPKSIDSFDGKIKDVLNKINNIIQGYVEPSEMELKMDFAFKKIPNSNDEYLGTESNPYIHIGTRNTASGIKLIGVIQLLLQYENLREGSFLIIDEPEVNLHPEWQFKFAEILVLLASELNITIYINSHSPMFIEAIDAFTEFYDMENDVNYYLTDKSDENENKYDFNKINSNELYKIYENLGNGYKLINDLRLRKRLSK